MTKRSLLGCSVASAGALRGTPMVTLRNDAVVVDASAEQVVERFGRELTGTDVVAARPGLVSRRCTARPGRLRSATSEHHVHEHPTGGRDDVAAPDEARR